MHKKYGRVREARESYDHIILYLVTLHPRRKSNESNEWVYINCKYVANVGGMFIVCVCVWGGG